jgi:hypothetical protein
MDTWTNCSVAATLLALRRSWVGSCRKEPTLWRDGARINKRVVYPSGFNVCGPGSPVSADVIERLLGERGKGADRVIVRPPRLGDDERRYCWILETSAGPGTGLRYSFDTTEGPESFAPAALAQEERMAIEGAVARRATPRGRARTL